MANYSQYKRYTRNRAGNVFYFTFLLLAGAFSVLPLIYCVATSFKPLDELLVFPPRFFVYRPTVENFTVLPTLFEKLSVPFSRYLFNSVFIAVVTVVLHIAVASLAAFGLSKSRVKGKTILFMVIQFALLYNGTTLAIPQYIICLLYTSFRMSPHINIALLSGASRSTAESAASNCLLQSSSGAAAITSVSLIT